MAQKNVGNYVFISLSRLVLRRRKFAKKLGTLCEFYISKLCVMKGHKLKFLLTFKLKFFLALRTCVCVYKRREKNFTTEYCIGKFDEVLLKFVTSIFRRRRYLAAFFHFCFLKDFLVR